MSSNAQKVFGNSTPLTMLPTSTYFIDFLMEDVKYCKFLSEVTYNATSSTTGVNIDIFSGIGNNLPSGTSFGGFPQALVGTASSSPTLNELPQFGDNSASVTMVTVTPSLGSTQTKRTFFYLDYPLIRLGGLVRLRLTNTDPANSASVALFADIS